MKNSVAVAILSKTPGFTDAKTRLAATIGKIRANQLHAVLVKRIIRLADVLSQDGRIAVYLAPAESSSQAHAWWQSKGLATVETGQGHLGWRMHTVHSALRSQHAGCILIGTDCLGLSAEHVLEAATLLDLQNGVIGPCHDGGFYLFGSRRALPVACWTQPDWGTTNAREQFLSCLSRNGHSTIATLDQRADLDTIDDAKAVLAELSENDPDRHDILACLGGQLHQTCP